LKRPFFSLILFSLCVGGLFARDISVTVTDADLDIPLEGAVIRSWDGKDYTCDKNGVVKLSVPDDKAVTVQATYPGYGRGQLVIKLGTEKFSLGLHLAEDMEGQELVVEAEQPQKSASQPGRSVVIAGKDLKQTSEIGIFEDVMSSVKLLPGVGYTGLFSAQPSIRGGEPGDLEAVQDGYYVAQAYHWGGMYSVFVPQMTESARLSHGVFSAREGNSISGILEITTKKPDTSAADLDFSVSTSETGLNASVPFINKDGTARGGIMFMGKVTYWDGFLDGVKLLSKAWPAIDAVNIITTAPYIRDFGLTTDYRFSNDMLWTFSGFFNSDGVGAKYDNTFSSAKKGHIKQADLKFNWNNYQAYGITGLSWTPRNDMMLHTTLGAGWYQQALLGHINSTVNGHFHIDDAYNAEYPPSSGKTINDYLDALPGNDTLKVDINSKNNVSSVQARGDLDWSLGKGFLFSSGVQERYNYWLNTVDYDMKLNTALSQIPHTAPDWEERMENAPTSYNTASRNSGLYTSTYGLLQWASPNNFINTETGLRLDHFLLIGNGFNVNTIPAVNPRLNVDFNVLKSDEKRPFIDTLTVTLGTGLFSSVSNDVNTISADEHISNYELKPNRSWTGLAGIAANLHGGWRFSLEAYAKWVYQRGYTVDTQTAAKERIHSWYFNGQGRIAGFDLMLQKFGSDSGLGRWIDGWLSYSFNWAQYRDPDAADTNPYMRNWYFPDFQRYSVLNLVLNFHPTARFNTAFRFGLASGAPAFSRDNNVTRPAGRGDWDFPTDVKFTWKLDTKKKVMRQFYFAIQNLQAIFILPSWVNGTKSLDGTEDPDTYTANFEIPVPLISFGLEWSF
jgi:hypothetical protein